ncbi:MAG: TonB-dependent receptor, partial [Bacteroidota bacterium]
KNLGIDWSLSDSRSQGKTPSLFSMDFRQNNEVFAQGVNADANPETFLAFVQPNLAQTILVGNQAISSETLEDNQTANLNFELPIKLSDKVNLTLKAGGKYKRISRKRIEDEFAEDFYYLGSREIKTAVDRYEGPLEFLPQNPALVNAQSFSTNANEIEFRDFDGQDIGLDLSIDPERMRDWYDAQREILTQSREPLIDNYEVTERVSAGYAMAKLKIGEVLTIIPGFRYEFSNNEYTSGLSTISGRYGVNGFFSDTTVNLRYGQFLPHLHAKYEPTKWLDVRFSYSTTMARPDFNFITPRFQIDDNAAAIVAGNPNLQHAVSRNYDLSVSAYKGGYGLISAGVFYKQIDNLFYPWRTFLVDDSTAQVFGFPDNRGYDYQSYVNSENGFDYGFEFDFQTNLGFLPKPFSGLVLNINYTRLFSQTEVFFLTSETRVVRQRPLILETIFTPTAREVNLLSQAPHIFRASLGYDYKGFSFRVSAAYQGTKSNNYSINKDFDTFDRDFWRYDASIKQRFGEKWSLFVNLNNFGNQRDISFTRSPNFTNSVQTFGATANVGLQYQIR